MTRLTTLLGCVAVALLLPDLCLSVPITTTTSTTPEPTPVPDYEVPPRPEDDGVDAMNGLDYGPLKDDYTNEEMGDGGDQPQGQDDGTDPYGPQVPEAPEVPRVIEVPNYGENEVAPMRQRDPLSAANNLVLRLEQLLRGVIEGDNRLLKDALKMSLQQNEMFKMMLAGRGKPRDGITQHDGNTQK
ncbi:hypothetical protein NP493_1083g00009 [Ridgeia piscesae]|uniref:Uncharacterized protein n=1 Tax=Ridgeia piscesae TaxID=27915 RepID=A0AAD9KGL9_RIDPI|nr:hypothetical protein NP493_1083g00009 [Ridgeia piscesae]